MQDPTTYQAIKPQFPEQEQLKCPRCDSSNTKFCYYNNYNLSQPRHFCKNCRRYWTKGGALRNIPVGGGSRKNAKRSTNTTKRHNPDSDPTRTRKSHDSSSVNATTTTNTTTTAQQSVSNSGIGNLGSDHDPTRIYGLSIDQDTKMLDISGSFSSLLASHGQFGGLLEGLNPNGSGLKMVQMGEFGENFDSGLDSGSGREPGMEVQGGNGGGGESYLGMQSGGDSSCWGGGGGGGNSNGWPDLAIYTPGTKVVKKEA